MSQLPLPIETLIPTWPRRERQSHKGDYGRGLLIGGSRGMAGAIALSGMAALRSGAGLVTLATADVCLETVAGFHPAYMTIPLRSDARGQIDEPDLLSLQEKLESASVVAVGPGLGRSESLRVMVNRLYQSLDAPLVIDADGLFALSPLNHEIDSAGRSRSDGSVRVLTPHAGELRRLVGENLETRASQEAAAIHLAREHRLIVVLKGSGSLVTDGERAWRCQTGNPGMATGGTGDVLTGILAALLAQFRDSWQAVCLGVHLHGLAGDFAAQRWTEPGITAVELIESLHEAIGTLYGSDK